MAASERVRARDLGIKIGQLDPGPLNAITDVAGVRVGHSTIISGDGLLVVGKGPIRTGVTVIMAREVDPAVEPGEKPISLSFPLLSLSYYSFPSLTF